MDQINSKLTAFFQELIVKKYSPTITFGIPIIVTLIAFVVRYELNSVTQSAPFLFFFGAIMISAILGGFKSGVLSTLISAILAEYFLRNPPGDFTPHTFGDLILIISFISLGVFVSILAEIAHSALRDSENKAQQLQQKQIEIAKAAEKTFEILESINEPFLSLDSRFHITYINRRAEPFLQGRTREELQGKTLLEVAPQFSKTRAYPKFKTAMQRKKSSHFEEYYPQTSRWIEYHLYPAKGGLSVIFQDITKKKKDQELVLSSNSIIQSTDDAIIGKNLDGTIISWNPAAERLFGYSAGEAIGQSLKIIIPDDKIEEFAEIMEVLEMGESIDHLETVHKTKDGKRLDVLLTISPIKDERGKVVAASTIARDITQYRELERRKDAFIGMASHELKTPLTTLKAFSQILQQKFKASKDKQITKYLTKMESQIDRLTELVSDLLDLSKIQAGRLELNKRPFDFNRLVKETIADIRQLNKDYEISLEGSISQKILGDRGRLSQVLINLLTNAIKYSPESKKIIVKIIPDINKVTLSIQDFGIGISNIHLNKIFDRFYRAAGVSEKTFPGLGIGLYISAEIIKRHGGTIWATSVKKKGSTFSFSLPLK